MGVLAELMEQRPAWAVEADESCRSPRYQRAVCRAIQALSPFSYDALKDPNFGYHDLRDDDGHMYAVLDDDPDDRVEILAEPVPGRPNEMVQWASKKKAADDLAATYFRLSEKREADGNHEESEIWRKRGMRAAACHDKMVATDDGEEMRWYYTGTTCNDPLCPIEAWQRSKARRKELGDVLQLCLDESGEAGKPLRPLMLTLTVPNCKPDEIRASIKAMHAGFERLVGSPEWNRCVEGYFRKTEWPISRSKKMAESGEIINLHMHVLVMVPSSYFTRPEEWRINLKRVFRSADYSVRKNAGACETYDLAANNVRKAVIKGIRTEAKQDGVYLGLNPDNWPNNKYLKRYRRLEKRVEALIDAHKPPADCDSEAEWTYKSDLVEAVAEAVELQWMSREDWTLAWQKAMRNPGISDVHVTPIRDACGEAIGDKRGEKGEPKVSEESKEICVRNAVLELAKYETKNCDIIGPARRTASDPEEADEIVGILREQLSRINSVSYGGCLREARKHLEALRREFAESNEANEEQLEPTEDLELILAVWSKEVRAYTVERLPLSVASLVRLEGRVAKMPVSLWRLVDPERALARST